MKALVVEILLAKASERDPGRDECDHIWLIKTGHVLVWRYLKFLLVVGREDYHEA